MTQNKCIETNVINYEDKEDSEKLHQFLQSRQLGIPEAILKAVEKIIKDVREIGDEALFNYTRKFDGIKIDSRTIEVPQREIISAYMKQSAPFKEALGVASERIYAFHERFLPDSEIYEDEFGNTLGKVAIPVERAGCYIPGGRAAYPSTVLMTVIPAKVAGVKEIFVCVPSQKNGRVNEKTLAAMAVAKPDRVFKIGGAQAIAAMAYGTQTIPKVDVIVGPGNIFVAGAKKLVNGDVKIDIIAGPSEVAIIADRFANSEWIAYDIMAQLEHDPNACSFLISNSTKLIDAVLEALQKIIPKSNRSNIIKEAVSTNGWFIKVKSLKQAVNLTNRIAPEHLELSIKNPSTLLPKIKTAGAIFLGYLSAESFGDYILGPNHTLPTQGTARFSSPLSSTIFFKEMTVSGVSKEGIINLSSYVKTMANAEGFQAHADSVNVRYRDIAGSKKKENKKGV